MTLFDIPVTTIDGRETTLESYRGHVLLIVNVASRCGFTNQYEGLETLYRKYRERDFVVLGFPCNQFLGQEPDHESKIATFCSTTYDVTFPLFAKVQVNGRETHPLYEVLKSRCRGIWGTRAIKWNFTKFLVDRKGQVTFRAGPWTKPFRLENQIQDLLSAH